MGDAFHQAAIADKDIGVVVDNVKLGPVKLRGQVFFGHSHTHRVGRPLPERIRDITGVRPVTGAERIGQAALRGLRWALGSSPSWHIALVRTGTPVPDGLFRQPLTDRARAFVEAGD